MPFARTGLGRAPSWLRWLAPLGGGRRHLRPETGAGRQCASRVDIVLQVGGDAILASQGKKTSLPMSVVANVAYDEKLIEVAPAGARPFGSLRYYDQANVAIKIDRGGQKPTLREAAAGGRASAMPRA